MAARLDAVHQAHTRERRKATPHVDVRYPLYLK